MIGWRVLEEGGDRGDFLAGGGVGDFILAVNGVLGEEEDFFDEEEGLLGR